MCRSVSQELSCFLTTTRRFELPEDRSKSPEEETQATSFLSYLLYSYGTGIGTVRLTSLSEAVGDGTYRTQTSNLQYNNTNHKISSSSCSCYQAQSYIDESLF